MLTFPKEEHHRLYVVLYSYMRINIPGLARPAEELIFEAQGLLRNQSVVSDDDYEAWASEAQALVFPAKLQKSVLPFEPTA